VYCAAGYTCIVQQVRRVLSSRLQVCFTTGYLCIFNRVTCLLCCTECYTYIVHQITCVMCGRLRVYCAAGNVCTFQHVTCVFCSRVHTVCTVLLRRQDVNCAIVSIVQHVGCFFFAGGYISIVQQATCVLCSRLRMNYSKRQQTKTCSLCSRLSKLNSE
jgi:hypothetical protein